MNGPINFLVGAVLVFGLFISVNYLFNQVRFVPLLMDKPSQLALQKMQQRRKAPDIRSERVLSQMVPVSVTPRRLRPDGDTELTEEVSSID